MTTTPNQQHNGSAAPSKRGDKKAPGFGARVVKARERRKLQRSKLCFQMHAARCDVQHPEPFRQRDWPEAGQKAADALWNRIAAIEKGKARDPELEVELSQRLGIAAPKPPEKATAPAKATKPTVTVAAVRAEGKRQGKFTITSIREGLLERGAAGTRHTLWHGVRQILLTDPSFERVGKIHFALREQAVAGDLVLEDGAHGDNPAERADFERGAVASAAMAETDEAE